jgi:hypothetical protein
MNLDTLNRAGKNTVINSHVLMVVACIARDGHYRRIKEKNNNQCKLTVALANSAFYSGQPTDGK